MLFCSLYDLQRYVEPLFYSLYQRPAVAAVCKYLNDLFPAFYQLLHHFYRSVPVLYRGTLYNNGQDLSQAVYYHVALDALYFLARIKTPALATYKRILNRLRINDAYCWPLVPSFSFPYFLYQFFMYVFNYQPLLPGREIVINDFTVWKIMWQHAPLAACFYQIKNCVHDVAQIIFAASLCI